MKKKIINGILLVALVIAASSAFVSCKDHDADVDTDLYAKIADLKAQIDNIALTPGPKGDKGDKGDDGAPGAPGAPGADGANGADGHTPTADEIKAIFADEMAALEQRAKDGASAEATKNAVDSIQKKIDEVKEALKGFVSSLTAEGTYNPIFGAVSVPVSITSKILGTYYGDGEATDFHGEKITEYVSNDGGTIYFTVNPSEAIVDPAGFTLVNSQDEACKVTLAAAESDKVLSWGWQQTRNASGLYAADVTIDDLDAVKFDYSDIANSLKDAIKERSKSSIISLVGELYNTITGDQFPRLALKYTSTDDFFGTRTVRTGYEFGIAAIKPLSYDFDVQISKTPGVDKIEKFINKLFNKIQIEFPDIDPNLTLKIKHIDLEKHVVTITIPEHYGASYNWDDGRWYYDVIIPEQDIDVNVADLLQDDAKTELDIINKDLATVNALIAEIQELNKVEVSYDKSKSDVKSLIEAYLKAFDKKVVNLVNSTNKALQPTLLVKTNGKVKRAGSSVEAGDITLIPTSYTAEIIAPAFKKFVKVECDGQEISGENLSTVIDGSICEINLKVEAGKNYKVTYDAIDFFGKKRSNVYFISAK